jgi:surface carbohydrate biosynthesis protein
VKNIRVYLPLEIFKREYIGKLILAVVLAGENVPVIIGNKNSVIKQAQKSWAPGVFFEKSSKADLGMMHLDRLKKKLFKIVAQDEESGISFTHIDTFANDRFFKNINFFDKFFCWGNRDYEYIKSVYKYDNIELTGSPRTTLWGKLGFIYWEKEITQIKAIHDDYILVVSNLSFGNGILEPKLMNSIQRQFGGKTYSSQYIEKYADFESELFNKLVEIIKLIVLKTDFDVIVRLHPTEKSDLWERLFKSNDRVNISSEGEIDPFVLASSSIIHTSSTVAYQAISVGIPTYSIDQFISKSDDLTSLPNRFSIRAKDLDELCLQISQKTQNSLEVAELVEDELIHDMGSLSSVHTMSRVIKDLIDELEGLKFKAIFRLIFINLGIRIELWISEGKSSLGFLLKRQSKAGKINFTNLGSTKRPEIQIRKIEADVEKICQILDIKNQFVIEKSEGNSFSIKKFQTREERSNEKAF